MITSWPPSPSMVVAPEPALIVLAPADPTTDMAVVTTLAFTLVKFWMFVVPDVA